MVRGNTTKYTQRAVDMAIADYKMKTGMVPSALDCKSENSLPSYVTVVKHSGSIRAALIRTRSE